MVLSYKTQLDSKLLKVSSASKNPETGKWDCNVTYEDKPLVFCSPRVNISSDGLYFNLNKKKQFLDFLRSIDEAVISYISNHSEEIFNGKSFTMERLKNSLQPQLSVDEQGNILMTTTFAENIKCLDPFGDTISLSDVGSEVSANIRVEKVTFTKDLFKIRLLVSSLKASKVQKTDFTFNSEVEVPNEQEKPVLNDEYFFD